MHFKREDNSEAKNIYSSSNENKYKKEFEYAQKYRYRLEYNPKDSEELNSIEDLKFEVSQLAKVIELVNKDELSSTNSKLVIEELVLNG